jgi:hypothetical protein
VNSIGQENKTAEGYANRSRRDFQFDVGDSVLFCTKFFISEAIKDIKRKLAANFAGPHEIIKVKYPVSYLFRLLVGTKAHDIFQTSKLKPYHVNASTDRANLLLCL